MGKSQFFLSLTHKGWEKRGCRERSFDFSLTSTELEWSSLVGARLKVGVLIEGKAWTPKLNQEFSSKIRAECSGGRGFRAFGSSKSFLFAPRGREPSYSCLFSI